MTDHDRPLWADLPHSGEISALLDELRDLTDVEAHAMDAARVAAWGTAWSAAWAAAGRAATRDAASDAMLDAAWDAVEGAVAMGAGRAAARDAAMALVVADLVGQYGLTREHLDTLTGPARTIPRLAKIIDRALAGDTPEAVTS